MSLSDGLLRLKVWVGEQTAADDAKIDSQPAWWLTAKVVFGLSCALRGVNIGMTAEGPSRIVLAILFFAAGAALVLDNAMALHARRLKGHAAH